MAKILVTGGMGFIGSSIVDRLASAEHDIAIVDNFHTGSRDNLKDTLDKKNKIKIINCAAGECDKFDDKYEYIFHKGVYSSAPMYRENPLLAAAVIEDFIKLLEFSRKIDARVIWASTSSLYNGMEPPHKEDMNVMVTDYYTEARYSMERLAELYHKLYGLHIMGLRYFSVYGPKEKAKGKYANLISQFLWGMQKGEAPLVYGDGKQSRDFTYIEDVVEANMLCMKNEQKFGICNVGTGQETSINDMIRLLNQKLGKNIKPKYEKNMISNYVPRTRADTLKAELEIGFKAKVSLEEGIEKLIKFYSI